MVLPPLRGTTDLHARTPLVANHLAYEERVLVDLLDHLPVEPGSDDEAAILAPLGGIFDER
jgi:hypothetical protein